MKNYHLRFLLRIISKNGDVKPLLDTGLTYSQIADFIQESKSLGYVRLDAHELVLTELGQNKLYALDKKNRGIGSAQWITVLNKYAVPKLRKNDIYIPSLGSRFFKPRLTD